MFEEESRYDKSNCFVFIHYESKYKSLNDIIVSVTVGLCILQNKKRIKLTQKKIATLSVFRIV